jgi:hypothetical protein
MFRDERDALQYKADALEQKVREKDEEVESLQQERSRTEQENQQLKQKLAALGHLPSPPFWKSRWFRALSVVGVVGVVAVASFALIRATYPTASLSWSATLTSAEGVMVPPGTKCTVEGSFRITPEKTNIESLKIDCGGQLLKNTVYPFGGEGWRLIEEKKDARFVYQLQQATGDFRVDTSTNQAFLFSKDNHAKQIASFQIDTWSAPRTGEALFSFEHQ